MIACLDLEGVLIPEIWINVAERTGIDALRRTTRDEPDYDKLMQYRLGILDEHGITLPAIQEVIDAMGPLPGAKEFIDWLRERAQVIILSDTFYQFAAPLMRQLGHPCLFCHSLEVASDGRITGYRLRIDDGKRRAVESLRALNFRAVAAGDSYNDTTMLGAADAGILFRPPQKVIDEFPQFPVTTDLRAAPIGIRGREWRRNPGVRPDQRLRVVVAGAGAVGSVFGGLLSAAGHDVLLIGRAPHMAAIRRSGLRISGLFGEAVAHPETTTELSDPGGTIDAVLVAVKSHATQAIGEAMARWSTVPRCAISLQNGLGNVETLSAAVGEERVLWAQVLVGSIGPRARARPCHRLRSTGERRAAARGRSSTRERPDHRRSARACGAPV